VLTALLVLAALAGIVVAGRALVLSRYWVGFHGDRVAVFRGVPGEVAGLSFSRLVQDTEVTRAQVPPAYASDLDNGIEARDREDAFRIARCAPFVYKGCPADGTVTTTTTAVPTSTAPPTTVRTTTTRTAG
jgi:protein phosphatase